MPRNNDIDTVNNIIVTIEPNKYIVILANNDCIKGNIAASIIGVRGTGVRGTVLLTPYVFCTTPLFIPVNRAICLIERPFFFSPATIAFLSFVFSF